MIRLVALLLPLSVLAAGHENCHHPSHFAESCVDHPDIFPENLRSFQAFVSGFGWGDRNEDACRGVNGSYEYYSEPIYKSLFTGPSASRAVDGMILRGTAEEHDLFAGMLGTRPPSNWKSRAAGCDTIVCALAKMTGSKDGAYRALIVGKRDGYFISFDQFGNPPKVEQLWTDAEIRVIEQGLAKLPSSFRRLPTLKNIQRYPDGYLTEGIPGNSMAMAIGPHYVAGQPRPGRIVMFDASLRTANSMKSQIFFLHEIFHHRDFSEGPRSGSDFNVKAEFRSLSGWQRGADRIETLPDGRQKRVERFDFRSGQLFVRDYAGTNPTEDFAESGAHFILAPDLLQRLDPGKYNWFKMRVLEGQEFKAVKWPELDATVAMAGGWEKAFSSCFAAPHSYHPQRDGTQVNWPDPKKSGGFYYYVESPTNLLPHCLQGFARELVQENPFLCAQLNGDEIVHYLSLRMMPEVNAIEAALERGALYQARDVCEKKADFSPECVANQLMGALPNPLAVQSRTGGAPENFRVALGSLGARFTGRAPASRAALGQVEAQASAAETYSRCLLKRAAGDGGNNLFELRLFAPASASGEPIPGCWDEAARFLGERGVKLGTSAELKTQWQNKLQYEASGFEQSVVITYLRRAGQECRGSVTCKSDLAAHLAGAWAASKGLPQETRAAVVGLARRSAR
ncbi:MAG: hypothetical protein HUU37_03960 [Bdellovibrionales bacterium]|nr:hypothetical protein [Bdellovibrionales bacterium]